MLFKVINLKQATFFLLLALALAITTITVKILSQFFGHSKTTDEIVLIEPESREAQTFETEPNPNPFKADSSNVILQPEVALFISGKLSADGIGHAEIANLADCENVQKTTTLANDLITSLGSNVDLMANWLATVEFDSNAVKQDNLQAVMLHIYEELTKLASVDPIASINVAKSATDTQLQIYLSGPGIEAWSNIDPNATMSWLREQSSEEWLQFYAASVLQSELAVDPSEGLSLINSFPEDEKAKYYNLYATAVAETNPIIAYEWVSELSDDTVRANAMESLSHVWANKNPDEFIDFISSLPDENQSFIPAYAISSAALQKYENNAEMAIDWVDSLAIKNKDTVLVSLYNTWYNSAPELALQSAHKQLNIESQSQFFSLIASDLPNHDLSLAMDIFTLESSDTQISMVREIVRNIYKQNPDEAYNWVQQFNDTDIQTASNNALLEAISVDDPDSVFQTLDNMDLEQRFSALDSLSITMAQYHPEKLQAWRETLPLSVEEKQFIDNVLASYADVNRGEQC